MATDELNGEDTKPEDKPLVEEAPIVTQHVISLDGQELRYTVTTGMLPIKNEKGDIEANLFFRYLPAGEVFPIGEFCDNQRVRVRHVPLLSGSVPATFIA